MKKILFILLLIFSSRINSQCLLNGGFEDTYVDGWGNYLPKNWVPNFWGMMLDTTAPSKTAKGGYAYVIFNRDGGANTHERRAGRIQNRFKLNCLPTAFSAYVQYQVSTSNEKFLLKVVLFNRKSNETNLDTIAVGYIQPPQSEQKLDWTKYKAPIEYRKFVSPDSAEITIWASQPNSFSNTTALAVDEVNFEDTVQALSFDNNFETNQQHVVAIYPNPANNTLFVKINITEPKEYTLTVYDIAGKELFRRLYIGSSHPEIELNTAQLSTGAYLLKVTSDDAVILGNYKFLVSKP